MGKLKNHPGMWLRDDAANAINALEDKYGVIRINRAGVTEAEQQAIIDRWDRGEREGLYEPKRPARESSHVKNGGEAVDVYNYTDDRSKLKEFGFEWYGPSDPVHYTFTGWGGGAKQETEYENMIINIAGKAGQRMGGAYFIADGKASFLGGTVKGAPSLSYEQGTELGKRVSGITGR